MNLPIREISNVAPPIEELKTRNSREHRLYLALATFILFIVFIGFMRSYYLRDLFQSPALDKFLQVHGLVMSAWIALLMIQVVLISTKRVAWHRRLGTFGISVATLVFAMGAAGTFRAAAREVAAHSDEVNAQLEVLALELMQIVLFAAFFSMAIWQANQPAVHKRLMVLATLCILPNPLVRIFVNFHVDTISAFLMIWAALVLAIILLDGWICGGVHQRFALYSFLAIGLMCLASYLGYSSTWIAWSSDLVS
jgi:hypothetical protein